MRRTGLTDLPLHTGKAPRWLFERMKSLAAEVLYLIALEYGTAEVLRRFSDPFWFQAFGCLLGFDWHSSGITTTVMGAVKEGLKKYPELNLFVAGGKGKTSLKTPEEIANTCEKKGISHGNRLIKLSRLAAKIDNSAVQDGFSLYHHTFIFTADGSWAVIQQGLDDKRLLARRYHWLGERVKKMTIEPHAAVCCDVRKPTLNLVDKTAKELQSSMVELALLHPERLAAEMELARLSMPRRHHISLEDIDIKRFKTTMEKAYENQVKDFEELLAVKGAGAKFLRALALTAEIVHGKRISFKDPARYAFAHGGKDGHPFPVNRKIYDHTIETLKEIISRAKVGEVEKSKALKRLARLQERLT
ncbi:MAG: DUF763 domain-containing protein [Deferribacteres bacterium]|nr:DUF763 domain-containing protein [Deferribacteres bacterium]